MKIIGIDPGYDRLGIAVIEKPERGKECLVYSNCFNTSKKEVIHKRLLAVGEEISAILDRFEPNALAIETLFIDKNQKTGMRVAETRGIIIYEAVRRNIPVYEYSPMEIKMAVTGDGTSDKSRIFKMVGMLIELPPKNTVDDEYDAIAVALTCSATISSRRS